MTKEVKMEMSKVMVMMIWMIRTDEHHASNITVT